MKKPKKARVDLAVPIPGHPKYSITRDGRIFSFCGRAPKEKRLSLHKSGYLYVQLGWTKKARVHSLVLESFVGPRPTGMLARHLNGIKTDNRLENLKWGTSAENEHDKVAHGTTLFGERNSSAKLSVAEVVAIRTAAANGEAYRSLSQKHNISTRQICGIVTGTAWPHVREVLPKKPKGKR